MSGWLWRRLPGGTAARLVQFVLIAAAVGLLFWYVVYPWVSLRLPADQPGPR